MALDVRLDPRVAVVEAVKHVLSRLDIEVISSSDCFRAVNSDRSRSAVGREPPVALADGLPHSGHCTVSQDRVASEGRFVIHSPARSLSCNPFIPFSLLFSSQTRTRNESEADQK